MLVEEPIDVADLYRYQRYRWLYVQFWACLELSDFLFRSGESKKLAMRYRKFNLQALLDTSVKAAGNDEISCMLSFTAEISRLNIRTNRCEAT